MDKFDKMIVKIINDIYPAFFQSKSMSEKIKVILHRIGKCILTEAEEIEHLFGIDTTTLRGPAK